MPAPSQGKHARFLLFSLALSLPMPAAALRCGTALRMREGPAPAHPASPLAARAAVVAHPTARLLETAHFSIHYSLRGDHRVRTVAADSALMRAADSLRAALPPGISARAADSVVYARLDAAGFPHPAYVRAIAGYLEEARARYVDSLGMRAPAEGVLPRYFDVTPPRGGRYPVDVVDIGHAEPDGDGIFAYTFRPFEGGMLIENDFLYDATLGPDGVPAGTPITSRYLDRLVHDYSVDWEMGVKVTCFHELYHAVQFAYTPDPPATAHGYHIWYETGATAMEERNAPEVNDYLQYLPDYFRDLGTLGMFGIPWDDRYDLAQYGNAVFHLYLAGELGSDFDVKMWEDLAADGNDLPGALARRFAAGGVSASELFARFAAQLIFAGPGPAHPLGPFTPDIPLWPPFPRETLDVGAPAAYRSPLQAPFSIRALRLAGSGDGGNGLFLRGSALTAILARLNSGGAEIDFPPGGVIPLRAPAGGDSALLVLADGTFDSRGYADILPLRSLRDTVTYAYPNPAKVSGGALYFARLDRPAVVEVFGEDGIKVRRLEFSAEAEAWWWDLADEAGVGMKPGLYYYREGTGPLKALYLR